MKKWMRRIRAAIRMGLTWALAWGGVGLILQLLALAFGDDWDVPIFIGLGVFGFIAGTAFSGVLSLVEGRRRFDQMSLPRFAGWGAAGGFLLSAGYLAVAALMGDPGALHNWGSVVTAFTLAGAGSASGVLALARRAERRELLHAGEDVAGVGLTEGEEQELLGGGG